MKTVSLLRLVSKAYNLNGARGNWLPCQLSLLLLSPCLGLHMAAVLSLTFATLGALLPVLSV